MVDIISELFFFHNSFKATIRPKHIEPILLTKNTHLRKSRLPWQQKRGPKPSLIIYFITYL